MIESSISVGYNTVPITIECSISNGLPSLTIVGLASKAVEESKERLRAAITTSGYTFPKKRIVLNLAPADIPKNTSALDLAMAIAVLHADKQVTIPGKIVCIGELGLDGAVHPARGIIGTLSSYIHKNVSTIIIPRANAKQAAPIGISNVYPVATLQETIALLQNKNHISPLTLSSSNHTNNEVLYDDSIDMGEIIGQDAAKRALIIAAAGGHNVLMSGPPGTGKSMLAKAFIGILPALTTQQSLETTHVHSLAGSELEELLLAPPLRVPHHTSSNVALIGGGHMLKPGEISLAHNGVLFLDELPEFQRTTLEGLRQPLEDRVIQISRAQQSTTYPANFILIATSNPCPCGYYNSSKNCICSAIEIARYQKKLSGPILDRIDIHITVADIDYKKLLLNAKDRISPRIRKTVAQARAIQYKRSPSLNAIASNKSLKDIANIQSGTQDFLNTAAEKMGLSARSYMKTIKVARTIADLENSSTITTNHVAEALQYRPRHTELH